MHFGMPTLIETKSLEECAALCRELKLSFIELNMNLPQYQLESVDISRFLNIAQSYDIYYTIHLDENFNICDFNKHVAGAYIDTALQTIELAKMLGIPVINMHLSNGVYFTLPDKRIYLFDEYMDNYIESLNAFRSACENAIAGSGITICIENSDGYKSFSQKGLELLLESDAFGLTFDIGHNWSIGGSDENIIMKNEAKLRHMHFHDASGSKNHLVLGTGEIGLDRYFKLAEKHDCRIVFETKTIEGLKQSVEYINAFDILKE